MSLRRWGALVSIVGLCGTLMAAAPVGAASSGSDVDDLPVAFTVVNKNDSKLSCDSDGRGYVVHGHLVGRRSDLAAASTNRVVTLLLSGWDEGEWTWRFQSEPGYDFARKMAALGHVSVSIDMVGYDSSGHPAGSQVCWGSQADMTHQIVQRLRNGTYAATGLERAVSFTTVLVSGHDVGPLAALIDSYTWNDIDGILSQVIAHQGFTPYILDIFARRNVQCLQGGEGVDDPKDNLTPGGEYIFYGPPDEQFRGDLFLERERATGHGGADPRVIDDVLALRNRNPCGMVLSTASAFLTDSNNMAKVTVPVLLVFPGPDDPVIDRRGQESEAANYGSNDVTTAWLDSGHFMMLEYCADDFVRLTAHWIHEHWAIGRAVPMPAVGPHACVTEVRVKDSAS